ncbi:DUF6221 family protein [Streptomyces liangshanensis]|uniref:DUF6221 family protein n=1 Tax=Streptomyces liangshanensis TaxID=2717324 RepID=UPI0036DFA258
MRLPSPGAAWRFADESTDGRTLVVNDPHPDIKRKIGRRWSSSYEGLFMAEQIVRHDPARVLREIQAHRATVDDYDIALGAPAAPDRAAYWKGHTEALRAACLRLAAVHADHPEHQEEWLP